MSSEARAKLEELQALRLKIHRLEPTRPLRDARGAAAFVMERRIVMSTGHASLPVLSEAIAGRHLPGSWMAHPEVHRIYRILDGLKKHGVVAAPLVLGKETWMAPFLGPAVERIASDPQRRARVREQLPPLARRLIDQVESEGEVRMDRWGVTTKQGRAARLFLERELLVVNSGLHTEYGYHTSIVKPWTASRFSRRFGRQVARMTFQQGEGLLLISAIRSAVVAPEREVRRWFVFGAERIDALVAQAKLQFLVAGRQMWITCPQQPASGYQR